MEFTSNFTKSVCERGGDADADRADGRVVPRRPGPGTPRARAGRRGLRALPALGRGAHAHRLQREYLFVKLVMSHNLCVKSSCQFDVYS